MELYSQYSPYRRGRVEGAEYYKISQLYTDWFLDIIVICNRYNNLNRYRKCMYKFITKLKLFFTVFRYFIALPSILQYIYEYYKLFTFTLIIRRIKMLYSGVSSKSRPNDPRPAVYILQARPAVLRDE